MSQRPAILNRPSSPIQEQQKVSLFRIYVVYRSILSIVLLLSPLNTETRQLLGGLNPEVYLVVAIAFLATNLVLLALMQTRLIHDRVTQFSVFFTDIVHGYDVGVRQFPCGLGFTKKPRLDLIDFAFVHT